MSWRFSKAFPNSFSIKLFIFATDQEHQIQKAKLPIKIKWISFYISLIPLISNKNTLTKTQHKIPY